MKAFENKDQNKIVQQTKDSIDLVSLDPSQFHNIYNNAVNSGLLSEDKLREIKNYALEKIESNIGTGFSAVLGKTLMTKSDDHLNSEFEAIGDAKFQEAIDMYKEQIAKAKNAKDLINIKRQFNAELWALKKDLKKAAREADSEMYISLLQYHEGQALAAMNELDSQVVDKLADENFAKRHIVQIKVLNSKGELKPNNHLYEVEDIDPITGEFSLIQLDPYGGPSGYRTKKPRSEVYDFQNMKGNHADYGTSQELFEEDYILSMYMHNLNKEDEVNADNVIPNIYWIQSDIETLIDELEGANDREKDAAMFRFANKFNPSDIGKRGPRAEAFAVAKAVIKAVEKGSKISDEFKQRLVAQIHQAALEGTTQKVANNRVRNFIYDNMDSKENLNKKIRFRVNKTASVNANEQLENHLVSDNALAKDKMRVGLMHAKYTRKTDGSPYIGIHNQMNIDVALEVNLGTEEKPMWVSVGNPRNPRAYRKISGDEKTESVYNPATAYEAYYNAENEQEAKEILNEFNKLYSLQGQGWIDSAALSRMADAFENQTKFFEMMESIYDSMPGDEDVIIEGSDLDDLMTIVPTAGALDFNPKVDPKNPITGEDLATTSPEFVNIAPYSGGKSARQRRKAAAKPTMKPLIIDTVGIDKEESYTNAKSVLGNFSKEDLKRAGLGDNPLDALTSLIPKRDGKHIKSRY
jgi:hypothetical protein